MRIAILGTVLFVAMVGPATAQPDDSRTSVSAVTGFAKTFDDEGSIGRGWLIGGSVDRVLFGNTRAELSLEFASNNRDTGFFAVEGDTTIVGLSLVHRFGRRTAQPYIFGGGTFGHHSGKSRVGDLGFTYSSTNPGLRFGTGVVIVLNRRLELSPEFRMNGFFIDNDSDVWMIPSFGMRVGYRF